MLEWKPRFAVLGDLRIHKTILSAIQVASLYEINLASENCFVTAKKSKKESCKGM